MCQTRDAVCYGCKLPIGVGAKAGAAGGHLTHFSAACIQKAQARFEKKHVRAGAELMEEADEEANPHAGAQEGGSADAEEMSTPVKGGQKVEPHLGSRSVADNRRASRRAIRLGPARCRSAMACLGGSCGGDSDACDMFCHGCGVGIHGNRCFHLSAGRVSVGLFECAACNLQAARGASEEDEQPDLGEDANMLAVEAMLGRMTAGSENFGKAIARANKLQSEFVGFMTRERGGTFSLPVDSSASMELFARWMGSRRDLAPSLRQVVRALGALGGRSRRDKAVTKDVMRVVDDIMKMYGDDPQPKTRCTPKMFGIFVNELLPTDKEAASAKYISKRMRVLAVCEGVGGLRVGDACGADDCHGLVAENVYLLTQISTGERTVELELDSGKTGFKRHVNMIGTTLTSKVPVYEIFAEFCEASGFVMETWQEGDFSVSRPCAKVARLNLLAMLDEHVLLFRGMLSDPRYEKLQAARATKEEDVIFYMNQRRALKDNENKRYVNFAEASNEAQLKEVIRLCEAWGLGEYVMITPSPLLRATRGVRVSLMPLSEGSTYQKFTTLLPEAEKLAREREGGDPDFDLESRGEASYGNHSMREMADHVARQTMSETGASETDIDRMFGWCEAWYRKKMQLHYAGRDDRVKRAKITSHV